MDSLLIFIGLYLMLTNPAESGWWVVGFIIFIVGLVSEERVR